MDSFGLGFYRLSKLLSNGQLLDKILSNLGLCLNSCQFLNVFEPLSYVLLQSYIKLDPVLSLLLCFAAGMSGCGCRSSIQTFPKVPRLLSQCGTSMGLAEPSPLGEPQSPCLANMGKSDLSQSIYFFML